MGDLGKSCASGVSVRRNVVIYDDYVVVEESGLNEVLVSQQVDVE